ncbi:MAG: type II toxin-antitoxin system prevent-host-death family antitoxin [Actinomycetota bacterium]|nr:type II toxin-antitoxin system prevent-host-death family antitoxin [Actinomycetota bacterium]
MPEISSTDASRNFADLLDAVEHEGAHFTIVRRGKPVAHLEPVTSGRGADVKKLLRRRLIDAGWSNDLASIRELVEIEDRS